MKSAHKLAWKGDVLDSPIFRSPTRSAGAYGTLDTDLLELSTFRGCSRRLGLNAALQHPFNTARYLSRTYKCDQW